MPDDDDVILPYFSRLDDMPAREDIYALPSPHRHDKYRLAIATDTTPVVVRTGYFKGATTSFEGQARLCGSCR